MKTFFNYYGGKWRAAPLYPQPQHDLIIEPFAGAAGYSMRHHDRNVLLFDKDPIIAGTWQYLIKVSEAEIRSLPDIRDDQTVDDLNVCQEARWLIGWWLNSGTTGPCKRLSVWAKNSKLRGGGGGCLAWSPTIRERIASQLHNIRHWHAYCGCYDDIPDVEATWFIDPPYVAAGHHYKHGSKGIDYGALADWCKSRIGQVMVCEAEGADWLPFRPFAKIKASNVKITSNEVIWP